jgi:hypothetical protein
LLRKIQEEHLLAYIMINVKDSLDTDILGMQVPVGKCWKEVSVVGEVHPALAFESISRF